MTSSAQSRVAVRPARTDDAPALSLILTEIITMWNSDRPTGPDHVLAHYITHPDSIACSLAEDEAGTVLGFQSLRLARAGNAYDVTPGWGIIGSYVRLGLTRNGVGRTLFKTTCRAAEQAGVSATNATIGTENESGLAYYAALGFRSYATLPGAVRKRFDL